METPGYEIRYTNLKRYSGLRIIRLLDKWASRLIGPNSSAYFEATLSGAYCSGFKYFSKDKKLKSASSSFYYLKLDMCACLSMYPSHCHSICPGTILNDIQPHPLPYPLPIGRSRGCRGHTPPKGLDSFTLTYKIFETQLPRESAPPYEVDASLYGKSWIRHCNHIIPTIPPARTLIHPYLHLRICFVA